MSISRFQKATSTNIVYTGPNEALGPTAITNASNFNKFAKNDGGNVVWIALPLPDVNATTADQDQYAVVFDFASKSFVLRRIPIPYNLLIDTNVRYAFIPDSTSTTFTTGSLSQVRNLGITGSTYNINNIQMGNNTVLDTGSKGLKFNGVTLMSLTGAFPSTANNAFVFAIKEAWAGSTDPSTLMRSMAPGATNTNADVNLQFYYNGTNATANITVLNNGFSNTSIPQSGNNLYIISLLCNSGVTYFYVNGVLRAQATRQTFYNDNLEQMLFFNGETNSAFYNLFRWKGTAFAWMALENATLQSVQRAEGWIKWSSSVNGQPWILDASHPYALQAPSSN